jgi:hypothetical protein
MTTRERLENKLEKREDWALGRKQKAAGLLARNEPYTHDLAFNTQPGHIPERARVIAREDKAFEHLNMAEHHAQAAAGLKTQLENSIYSDDSDAVEALEARIAENEAQRATMREANKIYRANPKNQETPEKVHKLMELGLSEAKAKAGFTPDFGGRYGFADYELSNLGGRISADKKRLEFIRDRQQKRALAEESPTGVVIQPAAHGYTRVIFAEKPAREILDSLKAAGFFWCKGYWGGKADAVPADVLALTTTK